MADPVGSLFIEIAASTAKFFGDIGKVQKELGLTAKNAEKFGQSFMDAGALAAKGVAAIAGATSAAAAAIFAITKSYANSGDELAKMSDRTGESVESLSELRYMAALADTSLESLETAYKKLATAAYEASKGSAEQQDLFDVLGISIKDVNGNLLPTGELMAQVADRLGQMTNATERTAIATKLMGKGALENLPLLLQGSKAMREQAQEARELGVAWSTKAARAAEEFNDNLTRLGFIAESVKNMMGQEFLPVLNEMAESTIQWFKANKDVIQQDIGKFAQAAAKAMKDLAMALVEFAKGLRDWDVSGAAVRVFQSISAGILFVGKALQDTAVEIDVFKAKIGASKEDVDRLNESLRVYHKISDELFKRRLEEIFKVPDAPPPPSTEPPKASTTPPSSGKGEGVADRLEQMKAERQAIGELFMAREKLDNQEEVRPGDRWWEGFDPKLGNEQIAAVKHLQSLLPELTAEEARLVAIRNQGVANDVLKVEKGDQESAQATIDALHREVEVQQNSFNLQETFYKKFPGLIGSAEAIRAEAFRLFEDQENERLAILAESKRKGIITEEDYWQAVHALEIDGQNKRVDVIKQYPTFFEKQMQDLVNSNAFSISQITTQWTSGLANSVVKGGDFVKQAWEATQVAVIQAAINTGIQLAAQWALNASVELGILTATEAAKLGLKTSSEAAQTGVKVAGDAARVSSNATADATIVASNAAAAGSSVSIWAAAATGIGTALGVIGAAAKSLWVDAILPAIMAIGESIMAFLTATAAAMKATIFGIPVGIAILVGVAGIAAALAAMGAIKLAEGGIATGSTLANIGEGGSPEAVIPLNSQGADFMGKVFGGGPMESGRTTEIHIHTNLNGRELAHEILEYTIDGLRLRGATI